MLLTVVLIILPLTISVSAAFTDVPSDHIYKDAIDFCFERRFVIGETSTTFMPDFKLTRADFAVIWCRTLNYKDVNHQFTDITKLKQYFDSPAIVLNSLGLFLGKSDTLFSPEDYMTREELAVITMRTYEFKVLDPNAYQQYNDRASISDWARKGISACINANVFKGLYTGDNFKPNEPVTRAEICKLIYNIMPSYEVTIDETVANNIKASPLKAHAGMTITLTITPPSGQQLKAGSLMYDDVKINGTTFIMPKEDVTITAKFEDKPVLVSIKVTSDPTRTTYKVNDILDLRGLVVTATYSDNINKVVTGYITTPADGYTLDTKGTIPINVEYKEGGITQTTTFNIQVVR